MGILMITHDLSTAAHFADRIAVMYLGRIVEEGPAREVVRDPQHPYTKALLSVVPKRDPRERTSPEILHGRDAEPVDIPAGLPVPPALPVGRGSLQSNGPAAPCGGQRGRRAAPGRLHPRLSLLPIQPVDAFGVRVPDHRRDPDPVVTAPIARSDPRADDIRERATP